MLGTKDHEVDLIASIEGRLVPFEVKYRAQATGVGNLKGLAQFCGERNVERGYVITKNFDDFGTLPLGVPGMEVRVAKIPAPLACYWLGLAEVTAARSGDDLG